MYWVLAIEVLLLVMVLCVAALAYGHRNFTYVDSPLTSDDDFVIQVDDFGQFWDWRPAEDAIARIRDLVTARNVIVALYIHGWNHNASEYNQNLREFSNALDSTRSILIDTAVDESHTYRHSRQLLTGTEELSFIGIYIGWRGRSLPGILNFITFWGRKAVAERIGEGDLREFLFRLNEIYRERLRSRMAQETRHFMGMSAFGHSFGGQVLFRAVAQEIENELIRHATTVDQGGSSVGEKVETLGGFGDLIVLVNPALEAMQFDRVHRLASRLNFGPKQCPVLLVISSAGDIPRQVLFPIGRHIGSLLRPRFRAGQRALWTKALGEYGPQRTHTVELVQAPHLRMPPVDPIRYTEDPCSIANLDLSNVPLIAGVRLKPTESQRTHNPIIVAYADTRLVVDHSDVFESELRMFLNDYIAMAQGKRMLLTTPGLDCS